jgi:hypothetical protein
MCSYTEKPKIFVCLFIFDDWNLPVKKSAKHLKISTPKLPCRIKLDFVHNHKTTSCVSKIGEGITLMEITVVTMSSKCYKIKWMLRLRFVHWQNARFNGCAYLGVYSNLNSLRDFHECWPGGRVGYSMPCTPLCHHHRLHENFNISNIEFKIIDYC